MTLRSGFDPSRWVEATGYAGRLFLGGNPHTHLGRVNVWSDALDMVVRISARDVTAASETAAAWLDGFLAGNEPGPSFMFGPEIFDRPGDEDRWRRWRDATDDFRRTGTWSGGAWQALTPVDPGAEIDGPIWTWLGDELWEWTDGSWSYAARQPRIDGGERPDRRCLERNRHSLEVIDSRHVRCEWCGETTEGEEEGGVR